MHLSTGWQHRQWALLCAVYGPETVKTQVLGLCESPHGANWVKPMHLPGSLCPLSLGDLKHPTLSHTPFGQQNLIMRQNPNAINFLWSVLKNKNRSSLLLMVLVSCHNKVTWKWWIMRKRRNVSPWEVTFCTARWLESQIMFASRVQPMTGLLHKLLVSLTHRAHTCWWQHLTTLTSVKYCNCKSVTQNERSCSAQPLLEHCGLIFLPSTALKYRSQIVEILVIVRILENWGMPSMNR